MKMILSKKDLAGAPPEVIDWLFGRSQLAEPAAKPWAEAVAKPESGAKVKPKARTEPAMGPQSEPDAEPSKGKPSGKSGKAEGSKPNTKGEPSMLEVMEKAVGLLESKGEDVLKAVLDKVGISRVKECPPEKLADLLAEISVQM